MTALDWLLQTLGIVEKPVPIIKAADVIGWAQAQPGWMRLNMTCGHDRGRGCLLYQYGKAIGIKFDTCSWRKWYRYDNNCFNKEVAVLDMSLADFLPDSLLTFKGTFSEFLTLLDIHLALQRSNADNTLSDQTVQTEEA